MIQTPDDILAVSPYLQFQLQRHPAWQGYCEASYAYAEGELVQNIANEITLFPATMSYYGQYA